MKRVYLKTTLAFAGLFICSPAFAQGASEYGGALSGAATQGAGLHSQSGVMKNLLDSSMSQAGKAIFGNGGKSGGGGGGRSGGSGGGSAGSNGVSGGAPVRRLTEEEAARYADLVTKEYKSAQAAIQKGDLAGGMKHLSYVVSTREDIWGKYDPSLPELYRQQGDLYRKQHKLPDAINCYKKELLAEGKRYGEYSPQSEKTVKLLVEVSDEAGNSQDSSVFLKKLYDIQLRPGGDQAAAHATGLKLCTALTVAGDFQTAEAMLKQAINAQVASPKPDSPYLEKLYENYGGLLREMHRDDEATDMEKRAAALKAPAAVSAPASQ